MSTKGISIIIPCHNDARFVREAIESVYAQNTSLPFEIIIIDDGSTDDGSKHEDTAHLLKEICQDYPDIRFHRCIDAEGVANARNIAISMAKYDYIFPLDADNKLETDPKILGERGGYMDRAVAKLESDPDTVLVHCQARLFDGAQGLWRLFPYSEKLILSNNMIDAHMIFRKGEAQAIGGYNLKQPYAADWDFAVAMLNKRHKDGRPANVHKVKDPLFCYRVRADESNISARPKPASVNFHYMLRRSPDIFRKHFPGLGDVEDIKMALVQKHREESVRFHLTRFFDRAIFPRLMDGFKRRAVRAFGRVTSNDGTSGQEKAFHRQDSQAPRR